MLSLKNSIWHVNCKGMTLRKQKKVRTYAYEFDRNNRGAVNFTNNAYE